MPGYGCESVAIRIVADKTYSFRVAGNDLAGWAILATPEEGDAIPLPGLYVSRQHAVDQMARVSHPWATDRDGERATPSFVRKRKKGPS